MIPLWNSNISTLLILGVILTSISLLPPTQGGVTKIDREFKKKIDSASEGSTWTILAIFKTDEKKLDEIEAYVKSLNFSEENEHLRTYETVIREEQYAQETLGNVIEAVKKFQRTNPSGKKVKWDVFRGMNCLGVWNTPKDLLYLLGDIEKREFENLTRIEEEITYDLETTEEGQKPSGLGEETKGQYTPMEGTWGLARINAPAWWAKQFNGTGIIIGHISSGVDIRHPSLKWNWVGKGEGWLDPGPEGYKNPFPYEGDKTKAKGTHSLGILAGWGRKKRVNPDLRDEGNYVEKAEDVEPFGVGVAPGARWSSCAACDEYRCYGNYLNLCSIFFECPNPKENCRYKPDIVSIGSGIKANSKYNPKDHGVSPYQNMLRRFQKAGIIPVITGGSDGLLGCQTIVEPENVGYINVGNVDITDTLNPMSSMGPPYWRYTEDEIRNMSIVKPDFVAPGGDILSTFYTGRNAEFKFDFKSGSSFATPHVAGLIALLLSRTRGLTYAQVKEALISFAVFNDKFKTSTPNLKCGVSHSDEKKQPNHKFGWGRVYLPPPDDLYDKPFIVARPIRKMPPPPDYSTLEDNSTPPKVRAGMVGVVVMAGMAFLMNLL